MSDLENICYHMYESSGNSKYVLAGRKPLHPDEALKQIEAYISKQILKEAEWWRENVITALDGAAVKRADERIEKLNLGDK